LFDTLVPPAKKWLRRSYRKARSRYVRWRYRFTRADLLDALHQVGIVRGDAILVHSAIAGFEGFDGRVPDIVSVFEEALGPEGTLLMPTLSMSGTAVEFANSGQIFDPRTTPSQMGLLSEVFRRSKGVARSTHPTHSVAARGADVAWWLENHQLAGTPCGKGTPFHRLLERNGKVVLAGIGIRALTFFHCAEELLETRMPFSPFTSERYVMRCRVAGQLIETAPMRLYAPDVSRRRRLAPLEAELRGKGLWLESRTGSLALIAVNAADVLRTLEEMAGRGVFCYQPQ
jgi:aminoglycoside 3-N-acetyltransferase